MFLKGRTAADYVTIAALFFCGTAYTLLLQDRPYAAILAIDAAYLCDAFDGALARRLNIVTRFGAIFDSLSDALIYVVFGALFVLRFFHLPVFVGIMLVWIMIACGLIRLAYFTEHGLTTVKDRLYYQGLIVPYHLLVILALFFLRPFLGDTFGWIAVPLLLVSSFLMISDFPVRKVTHWGILIGSGMAIGLFGLWGVWNG